MKVAHKYIYALASTVIFFLVLVFSFHMFNEDHVVQAQAATPSGEPSSISIRTDRGTYVGGQTIRVSGNVYDSNGNGLNIPVFVSMAGPDGITLNSNVLAINGTYQLSFNINTEQRPGRYNISATLQQGGSIYAWSIIEIQELFFTRAFIMLYILGGGGFIALIVVIILRQSRVGRLLDGGRSAKKDLEKRIEDLRRQQTTTENDLDELRSSKDRLRVVEGDIADLESVDKNFEMYRFVCLSVIAFAPIVALALTDVEITPNAPIGLVTKPMGFTDIQNNTRVGTEWMINIGGDPSDNYNAGIQVPVNVFIFGIAGAYLRFLYKTASERGQTHSEKKESHNERSNTRIAEGKEGVESSQSTDFFYESLKDIALFFLSPLLAIAIWLILWQGGMTSTFTLAAVSFGVGLVTNDIVNFIIGFMKRITSASSGPSQST